MTFVMISICYPECNFSLNFLIFLIFKNFLSYFYFCDFYLKISKKFSIKTIFFLERNLKFFGKFYKRKKLNFIILTATVLDH